MRWLLGLLLVACLVVAQGDVGSLSADYSLELKGGESEEGEGNENNEESGSYTIGGLFPFTNANGVDYLGITLSF
jgi:hypothetical protein